MATPIPQNLADFQFDDVLEATGGTLVRGAAPQGVRGVATDTREDLRGKAFVALVGENFDGHAYLERAADAGASILIGERFDSVDSRLSTAQVRVDDTLVALGQLAGLHRKRWGKKLVAVVGSAGKTTTRSVISALLGTMFPGRVHSTAGNLNNRIGVPMVLFGLEHEHDYAVVELGTNCPGEVARLADISLPDVALLTLIDLEHTEGLGDLDGVEKEESAVFPYLPASGVAIGFGEDARVLRCIEAATASSLSYGFEPERDVRIQERELVAHDLSRVRLKRMGASDLLVTSPLVGRPGALAVAAGVSAVEALTGERLTDELCERALVDAGEPGRNQVIPLKDNRFVIDDTYNSNPASVENSISTGRELIRRTGGQLWLVLGEMLELGALSAESHRQMGELAARSGAAGAFFVQGDAREAARQAQPHLKVCRYFEDAAEVSPELAPRVQSGDVVVVKASRGVRAERVVQDLESFYKPVAASSATAEEGGSQP